MGRDARQHRARHQGNGIDGAHILTPDALPDSTGKVTQNNVPTPMYILARLNLDCQAISVSNEYKDLKVAHRRLRRSRPPSTRRRPRARR